MTRSTAPLQFALKVVSRCNLNCTYCYVYNKGDETWRTRPGIMPEAVFVASVERIRRHCIRSGQRSVRVIFHGGEPCLAGSPRFARWCRKLRDGLAGVCRLQLVLQTNGTLLDDAWVAVLDEHQVAVGISVDGPKEIHDRARVDHRGRGSYDAVERGIGMLRDAGMPVGVLSVIQFGVDPLLVHHHLAGLGASSIDYLLPDFTHDTIGAVRAQHGATPCADYLIPVFDEWWAHGIVDFHVGPFVAMSRAILGGDSLVDFIGNRPFRFLFVEADGAIEGLDVLRVCKEGMAKTGLSVLTNDFAELAGLDSLHRAAIFDGVSLPTGCLGCPEVDTCAGGYLPHRYSMARGLDNPSVWCADLLAVFAHIRSRLDVSVAETASRRRDLAGESVTAARGAS